MVAVLGGMYMCKPKTTVIAALARQAIGGQLMPEPDFQVKIVKALYQHTTENRSWLVGQLLRDFYNNEEPRSRDKTSRKWEALRITVFKQKRPKLSSARDADFDATKSRA